MPCSRNMCEKAEATADDDPECEAVGTRQSQRGEATDYGNTGLQDLPAAESRTET